MSQPVEIPVDRLDAELLDRIIAEFVLREGTDYGAREYTLEEKIQHVRRQLDRGEARVFFDPESESCTVVPRGIRGRSADFPDTSLEGD